jgi:hypothetical protein
LVNLDAAHCRLHRAAARAALSRQRHGPVDYASHSASGHGRSPEDETEFKDRLAGSEGQACGMKRKQFLRRFYG